MVGLNFVGQTFPCEEGGKGEGSTCMMIDSGCCQTCKLMYSSLHVLISIVVRDKCIGIFISRRMKINPRNTKTLARFENKDAIV